MSDLSKAVNKSPILKASKNAMLQIIFGAVAAYLDSLARRVGLGDAEANALYEAHLAPAKVILDSDGDGVEDSKDAAPHDPSVS